MGRGNSLLRRAAATLAVIALSAVALTSCTWPWDHPQAAPSAVPQAQGVQVSFPGAPSGLKAQATPADGTQQMKDALPSGAVMHQPVELKMTDGSFPSTGAQVSFALDQPLPADHQATIAYWNEQAGKWEGRATDVSNDRRTVTAKLEHFSTYSLVDTFYNGFGQFMGDKTSPPSCPGNKPSWADPTFDDDINGPVLWCVGTDAKNPDVLEVHLKMNRASAGSITTGIKPAWAWSDLWQNLTPETWTKMAADTDVTSNVLGDQYLIQPLGEYRFGFNRKDLDAFWRDHPNQPLIEVGSSPVYAMAGLLYQAMGSKAQGGMAGLYIMMSLMQCEGSITGAVSDQSVKQTFGALVECLNDRQDAIAQAMARAWSNMNPGAGLDAAKAAGESIGKAVSLAGDIYLTAKITLSLGAMFGDLTVNPAARQLTYFPSNDEVRRYVKDSSPAPTASPAPNTGYLFQIPNDGAGLSGTSTDTQAVGKTWPNSTTMWVGCGLVQRTQYSLDGKYHSLTATPVLRTGTPDGLRVTTNVLADGRPVQSQTLSPGALGKPITVDLTGVKVLEISATTEDTCGSSDLAYGALLDAKVQ